MISIRINRPVVIHLISTSFFGGPEKQIAEHLGLLANSPYKGILVSFIHNGAVNEMLDMAKAEGIESYDVPMLNPFDLRGQYRLNEVVRRTGASILCVHGYKSCVMGWLSGKMCGVPVLAFSRGYTSENARVAFYNWLESRTLSRVHGIVSVSHGQKNRLRKMGIKGKKHWVVHNAVEVSDSREVYTSDPRRMVFREFDIPSGSRLVASVGRLSPEKGHKHLLDAVQIIKKHRKDIYFLLCGEGVCEEELKEQARRMDILDCCRFAGFRKDIATIYKAMDLLVLPSLSEGLPNVVLESFALSRPVVATNVDGVPEVVEDGVNGLLVQPGKSKELSDAIMQIINDNMKLKLMGSFGRKKVDSEFTFPQQHKKLVAIYDEVLGA